MWLVVPIERSAKRLMDSPTNPSPSLLLCFCEALTSLDCGSYRRAYLPEEFWLCVAACQAQFAFPGRRCGGSPPTLPAGFENIVIREGSYRCYHDKGQLVTSHFVGSLSVLVDTTSMTHGLRFMAPLEA